MSGLLLCNNTATTLSAAITTTGQTSITVTSTTGMPSPGANDWFYLTLSDGAVNSPETTWEVLKVTNVTGNTLTVARGQDNTTAQTWENGSYIQARPVVQELRDCMAGPFTTLGDTDYCSASGADTHTAGTPARLAGPTTNGIYVLTESPVASAAVAPTWTLANTLVAGDISGGAAGQVLYQTGANLTSYATAANYGVLTSGSTGTPAMLAGATGLLVGSASANPAWLSANYGALVSSSAGVPSYTTPAAGVLYQASTTTVPAFSASPTLTLPVCSTGVVHTAAAAGTTDGEVGNDSTQKALYAYVNGVKNILVGCIFTQTATGTNGSATALTNILGTGTGTAILPTGETLVGKTVRVRVWGTMTTAATPGTTVLSLYFYNATASVTILSAPSVTPLASMTSMPFFAEFTATWRSTTSVIGAGTVSWSSSTSGVTALTLPVATTTAATTVAARAYTVYVGATNGTASGCVYTSQASTIEILN